MVEVKPIDYISGFIAKNKSRITKVFIGVTNRSTVRIVMNDNTEKCFEIGKSTLHNMYLYGDDVYGDDKPPAFVRRPYRWIDILLIYLRCDMKPPKMYVRMRSEGDPTFAKEIKSRARTFLLDLDFEEYSPELSQLLLDFVMKDPEYIMDVFGKGSNSIEYIKLMFDNKTVSEYDPVTSELVTRRYRVKPSLVRDDITEDELSEVFDQYGASFVSELDSIRIPFLRHKMEKLISSDEPSPEQKMFFVRYYREHYGSDEEKEVLRL